MTDDAILRDLRDLIRRIIYGDSIGIDTHCRSRSSVILDEDIDSCEKKSDYGHDIHTLEDPIYDEKEHDDKCRDVPLRTASPCRCKMPLKHNI
jgi:hypothetical protein